VAEIGAGVPVLLLGQVRALGRLVVIAFAARLLLRRDAVDRLQTRNGGLDADRAVAQGLMLADRVEQLGQVATEA